MHFNSITETISSFWQQYVGPQKSILVTVSGGSDSTALFLLLQELRSLLNISKLGIAHVEHGLRGEESIEDMNFVKNLAEVYQVPLYVTRLDPDTRKNESIEEWARKRRYAFFLKIMKNEKYDFTATGHTADDQAETVIMRILRGTGIKGLCAIPPIRDKKIIRPLLDLAKEELVQYLASRNQHYRVDSSNATNRFFRNWVRNMLIKNIETYDHSAVTHIASLAEYMRGVLKALRPQIEHWLHTWVLQKNKNEHYLNLEGFNDPVTGESLAHFLRREKITFKHKHIKEICALAHKNDGSILKLPDHWRAIKRGSTIQIRKGENAPVETLNTYRLPMPGTSHCPPWGTVCIEIVSHFIAAEEAKKDPHVSYIALRPNQNELVFRTVQKDDTFIPSGRIRSQNVLSFLKKQGYTHSVRHQIGVIADTVNRIVAIPGIRVDQDHCITDNTQKSIRIQFIPEGES